MSSPWYRDGLRFTCTRCGNCCTGAPGFVWITPAELTTLAGALEQPEEQVRDRWTRVVRGRRSLREKPNGDCVFWDRQAGCTVYEARPMQCRTWPFWEITATSRADWEHTCEVCPGAGRGELHPAEEVTRRIQLIQV